MPTYDYVCKNCGLEFEEFQSIVSEPIQICPRCQGSVQRVINGGAGLIFKGSGFYLTDYKKSSSSEASSKSTATPTNNHAGEKKSSDQAETAKKAAD